MVGWPLPVFLWVSSGRAYDGGWTGGWLAEIGWRGLAGWIVNVVPQRFPPNLSRRLDGQVQDGLAARVPKQAGS